MRRDWIRYCSAGVKAWVTLGARGFLGLSVLDLGEGIVLAVETRREWTCDFEGRIVSVGT